MKKYYLGINWEQNSSASLFEYGKLIAAISEERLSRVKNDERYPKKAINWLLSEHNIDKNDIGAVIFVSTQWAPSWILARHYTTFSISDYLKEQYEIWKPTFYDGKTVSPLDIFKEKLDLDQFPGKDFWNEVVKQYDGTTAHPSDQDLEEFGQQVRKDVVHNHLGNVEVHFMDHSFCHNAYAYFSQPNRTDEFLSLSLDAFGDGVNYSAVTFTPNKDRIKSEIIVTGGDFIIGRIYRYITLILGLKPNEHEYKVMGMAPYCKLKYFEPLLEKFKTIQDVEDLHFQYINRPKDHFFAIREMLFGERFDTIAGALQAYTEYLVSNWVTNLTNKTNINRICYAGGIAMNVKANMIISKLDNVETVSIPPTPDDTSQAIGAVYSYLHNNYPEIELKPLASPYLGRRAYCSDLDLQSQIKESLKRHGTEDDIIIIEKDCISLAAQILSKGAVLGLMWGQEEFGARALGNRSIIANPSDPKIKKKINEAVKDRDFWMPFAASILESHAEDYLNLDNHINNYVYMTNTSYATKVGSEKIPAALHPYDDTCRPHIVLEGSNPRYEELLNSFGKITGTYALLNTSLNLHGLPICSTLDDGIDVFVLSELDGLLLDNCLCMKRSAISEMPSIFR